jgi:hypothetical protein
MTVRFPGLDPATYQRHPMHALERAWPESNCYSDLWVELLHAYGVGPQGIFGSTVTQDYEGDQFTFTKPLLEDIERLHGLQVQELAIYDDLAVHIDRQLAQGRLSIVEVDSYFLPDTRGLTYRLAHGKTSVIFNHLDIEARRAGYFHGPGYHSLEGEDFEGVFRGYGDEVTPFLPYVEFIKEPAGGVSPADRTEAGLLLQRHLALRPASNPLKRFQADFPTQAESVSRREPAFFHLYAFNTLRQFGANFLLLSDHLSWLDPEAAGVAPADVIAQTAKACQFQLARACARKKFDTLTGALDPAVQAWDQLMADLDARWGRAA